MQADLTPVLTTGGQRSGQGRRIVGYHQVTPPQDFWQVAEAAVLDGVVDQMTDQESHLIARRR